MLINLNSVNDSPTINQNRGFILTLVPFIQRRFVRNLVVIELHKRIPLSTLQRLNWSFNLWRISFNFDNLLSSMRGRLIGDNRRRCISRDPEICGRNRNLRDKKKKRKGTRTDDTSIVREWSCQSFIHRKYLKSEKQVFIELKFQSYL